MKEQIFQELASFFYPTLLALVGFFPLQFYGLVKKTNDKTNEILIELAKGGVRFDNIEDRLEWLESEIEKLKELLHHKNKS